MTSALARHARCLVPVLTVALLAVAALLEPAIGRRGDATARAQPDAYDAVIDLTFPVAGHTTYQDDYDAPRGGGTRVHKATDLMAAEGTPVHAAMGGTITFITGLEAPLPAYGWMIAIQGDDGRRWSYIHLGRQDGPAAGAYAPGMARGRRVERGEHIGFVGCSGNASCSHPHLHLQVSDPAVVDPYGSTRRNPYAGLRAAQQRGDLPGAVTPIGRAPAVRPECRPTGEVPSAPVRRVAGPDPVSTSVEVARAGWRSADEALVATARDFADALAGAALAARRGSPLLLVGERLEGDVVTVLADLGVRHVTVLGGPAAVSDELVADLDSAVGSVARIAGPDRFATAAAVMRAVGPTDEIAVALGRHRDPGRAWPDAIAAGALAGSGDPVPVVLVTPDGVPSATASALDEATSRGARRIAVIGGPAAISEQVARRLTVADVDVERWWGQNRYETSTAVVEHAAARRPAPSTTLVVASGQVWTDAVTAAPMAAHVDAALLLVPPCNLASVPALGAHVTGQYRDGFVIGDRHAVSERVREELSDAMVGRR